MSTAVAVWDRLMDHAGTHVVPDPLPGPQQDGDVVLDVRGYRQTQSFTCGFVVALMVLRTFKPRASAARLLARVRPCPINGTSDTKLIRALRASGIGVAVRRDLDLAALARAIDEGFPIITTVKKPSPDDSHWVVIYGYGHSPNRVYVAGDGWPWVGRKVVPWGEFRRTWSPPGEGLVCWGR